MNCASYIDIKEHLPKKYVSSAHCNCYVRVLKEVEGILIMLEIKDCKGASS